MKLLSRFLTIICLASLIELCSLASVKPFSPVKIVVKRRNPETKTSQNPYSLADFSLPYDPFDPDDTMNPFNDFSNKTKMLKLKLETSKYIEKYGPQAVLDALLARFQTANNTKLLETTRIAVEQFLNFVEQMVFNSTEPHKNRNDEYINRPYVLKKLIPTASEKLHFGDVSSSRRISKRDYLGHVQRDAPPLADHSRSRPEHRPHSVPIESGHPIQKQPIQPTQLVYYSQTHGVPDSIRVVYPNKEIRRSPGKRIRPLRIVPIPVNPEVIEELPPASYEELEFTTIHPPKRTYPVKRKPQKVYKNKALSSDSFNKKVFELLHDYHIDAIRVDTDDYSVRAFADPKMTRFTPINEEKTRARSHGAKTLRVGQIEWDGGNEVLMPVKRRLGKKSLRTVARDIRRSPRRQSRRISHYNDMTIDRIL